MAVQALVEFLTEDEEKLHAMRSFESIPRRGDHILRTLEEDAYRVKDVVWWPYSPIPTVITHQVKGRRYTDDA